MGAGLTQVSLLRIPDHQSPDDLAIEDLVTSNLSTLIHGLEDPPFSDPGGSQPQIQAGFHASWHGDRTDPIALSHQIRNDPPSLPLLEIFKGERRTSSRRNPQPMSRARMARSRLPARVAGSGAP